MDVITAVAVRGALRNGCGRWQATPRLLRPSGTSHTGTIHFLIETCRFDSEAHLRLDVSTFCGLYDLIAVMKVSQVELKSGRRKA